MTTQTTGVTAYILVEDNTDALKEANRKIDQVLQCFWVSTVQILQNKILIAMQLENLISGTLVLNDVHQTVKDQEGWLAKLSSSVDRHFEVCTLIR